MQLNSFSFEKCSFFRLKCIFVSYLYMISLFLLVLLVLKYRKAKSVINFVRKSKCFNSSPAFNKKIF